MACDHQMDVVKPFRFERIGYSVSLWFRALLIISAEKGGYANIEMKLLVTPLTDFILFQFPVQRRDSDIEEPGGFCFIALGVIHDLLDMQFFSRSEREA